MKINRKIFGIVAFCIALVAIGLWAYWGVIETFHEGWYFISLRDNLLNMVGQYMSPMLTLIILSVISIYNPKIGGLIFLLTGITVSILVQNLMLIIPFFLLALLFWFSDFKNKWYFIITIIVTPVLIILVFGIEPLIRVSNRYSDNDYTARVIKGNNVELTWAPEGPGFPNDGTSWYQAKRICALLSEDGKVLMATPQNYWRLPTANEVVRSMTLQNKNCGGELDEKTYKPYYTENPDKESPLWKLHSKVIYLWTATEVDTAHAYMIAYDGKLWSRAKKYTANYLGFRAVKKSKKSL